MHAKYSSLLRSAGLWAGALFAITSTWAAGTAKPEADAFPVLDNYITVAGQYPWLDGNESAFQTRTRVAKSGAGGIEDLQYSQDLSKGTTFQVDGHLLPGAEDYLGEFRLTKEDVGSFEAGYKRFRTFYDGVGGFFPGNNAWFPLTPESLWVDRGNFFANATIALPHRPVFTFRYSNETRTGRKDSTIWGDTDLTGIPISSSSALNPISADRKIVPAYIDLGERKETWEATMKHTVGATTVVLSLVDTRIDNLDTRFVNRYPGERKPFPAIPSSPARLISPTLANNPNYGFDQQGFKEDALTFTGKVETVLSDQVTAYAGASYRHATEDITDSRLITADLATALGVVSPVGAFTSGGRPPYSYNSAGNLKNKVYTGNVGLEWKPTRDWHIDVGLKAEEYKASGLNQATFVNNLVVLATGAVTQQLVPVADSSKTKETPVTPSLDFRYTGIKGLTLYGTFDYRRAPGSEYKNYGNITTSGAVILPTTAIFSENVAERHLYYRAGANWNFSPAITLRAEGFMKDHENNFQGYATSLGNFYILDYNTYGARVTAIAKATPELTFNSRFIYEHGLGRLVEDGFVQGDSNNSKTYQFCETVDWAPTKQIYVQGNLNLVLSQVVTAYPKSSGAALDVLHNADNNYWNGSLVAGFVVDKDTDLQLQGTYYKADNYNAALAAATTPYGASVTDYSITIGVKHKFSNRLVGTAKVGYLRSDNLTTGGFTNFNGVVAYVALTQAL